MGKKSKANRKKAPVATSAATATTPTTPMAAAPTLAASTAAVATSETSTAGIATSAAAGGGGGGAASWQFPESTFFVKAESFDKRGNRSKAKKKYLQGSENGCVRCLIKHAMNILYAGATLEHNHSITKLINKNMNLHLVLPLVLEGAIRGHHWAIKIIYGAYGQARHIKMDGWEDGHFLPAAPLVLYWQKIDLKNNDREYRNQTKEINERFKKSHGTRCSMCGKHDSETVTLMKCEGCHLHFYCSKECQQKMWVDWQHAGVCRQLGILQKYHKPFAKKIWKDIVVHQMAPKDIPELQELRRQLGLSRPRADYQDLLEAANKQQLDQNELILPRKDGKVQFGSFPRLI